MSSQIVGGKIRDCDEPGNIGDTAEIPLSPRTKAVLVEICAGGGGLLPFGEKAGSGTLTSEVGGAASFGYADDNSGNIADAPVQYPRNVSTANVKLGIFVTENTFAATIITFTAYKDSGGGPAPTLLTIAVPAGATGLFQASGAFPYLDGDTWDLRADNPGGEDPASISFGYTANFF